MTIQDIAVQVLRLSNNGGLLTPEGQSLVQRLAGASPCSESEAQSLAQMHTALVKNEQGPWFHGIEHLTRNSDGYVYWKGKQVEHYSFRDNLAELTAATDLAVRCHTLESLGFPVNSRTALDPACFGAEANTPWKLAIQRLYSFFELNGAVIGIFYRLDSSNSAFSVEVADDSFFVTSFEGAYEAFHAVQNRGAKCMSCQPDYAEVVARLERLAMPALDLEAEIRQPASTAVAQHPTVADYAANRDFCIIHTSLTPLGISAKLIGSNFKIERSAGNTLRLGCYGSIEHVVLGQMVPRSEGAYRYEGVLIDYQEEKEALMRSAVYQLEELREQYLKNLREDHRAIQAFDIVIT